VFARAGGRDGLWFWFGQIVGLELDSGGAVGVDGGEGAEKQAADVRENGGAARGDAVLRQELVEVHEGMVDALRGLEKLELRGQVLVVIGGQFLFVAGVVACAEGGARARREAAALAAARVVMGAANGQRDGILCLRFHFFLVGEGPSRNALGVRDTHPRVFFRKSSDLIENKRVEILGAAKQFRRV